MNQQIIEHPILFTGENVRHILADQKSMTRRIIRPQPPEGYDWQGWITSTTGSEKEVGAACWRNEKTGLNHLVKCPYGQPGDSLWVKETWRTEELVDGLDGIRYRADNVFRGIENTEAAADAWMEANYKSKGWEKWRPSIFMPRWGSRLLLRVEGVKVSRLKEITPQDAVREGWPGGPAGRETVLKLKHSISGHAAIEWYIYLWNEINAKRGFSWASNPLVWVVEFTKIS